MKTLYTIFTLLAILLSDIMCAVVAYNYCDLVWGGQYAEYSAPARSAFAMANPYVIGIVVCIILAVVFNKKARACLKNKSCTTEVNVTNHNQKA